MGADQRIRTKTLSDIEEDGKKVKQALFRVPQFGYRLYYSHSGKDKMIFRHRGKDGQTSAGDPLAEVEEVWSENANAKDMDKLHMMGVASALRK